LLENSIKTLHIHLKFTRNHSKVHSLDVVARKRQVARRAAPVAALDALLRALAAHDVPALLDHRVALALLARPALEQPLGALFWNSNMGKKERKKNRKKGFNHLSAKHGLEKKTPHGFQMEKKKTTKRQTFMAVISSRSTSSPSFSNLEARSSRFRSSRTSSCCRRLRNTSRSISSVLLSSMLCI
jgi:hypothetical protein